MRLVFVQLDHTHRPFRARAVNIEAAAWCVYEIDVLIVADKAVDMVMPVEHCHHVAFLRNRVEFPRVNIRNRRGFPHEAACIHHVRIQDIGFIFVRAVSAHRAGRFVRHL